MAKAPAKKPKHVPSPFIGFYECTSDGLVYEVTEKLTKEKYTQKGVAKLREVYMLLMRRFRPENGWGEPYLVNTKTQPNQLKMLLDYQSFQRVPDPTL